MSDYANPQPNRPVDHVGRLTLRSRAALALAAVVAACVYGSLTWGLPFYTKGEPREAIEIQAIFSGESVLVPMRNGVEIPSKPPMFHWLGAVASLSLGEVTEFTSRVPSIVAAAGCVFLTGLLGARLYGTAAGVAAGVLTATAGLFIVGATRARVDMTLAFFTTAALTSFAAAYLGERRRLSHLFYLACALAVLTKGPVGVILPAAIIGVYLFFVVREPAQTGRLLFHPGLLWLLLPVGWYVAAYMDGGQAFLDVHLFRENIDRVLHAERADIGHAKPFWIYGPYLLVGFAPWSLFFPALGCFLWEDRRSEDRRGTGFLLTWIAVIVGLFTFAGAKRAIYLLPCYPAVGILLGRWWSLLGTESVALRSSGGRLVSVSAWLLVAFVAIPASLLSLQALGIDTFSAVVAATDMSSGDRANLVAASETIAARRVFIGVWAAASLALVVTLANLIGRGMPKAALIVAVGLIGVAVLGLTGRFANDIASRQTTRVFAREVVAAKPDATMYSFGEVEYATIFYAERPIVPVHDLAKIEDLEDSVVFVRGDLLEDVRQQAATAHRLVTVEIGRHVYAGGAHREPLIATRFQEVTRPTAPRTDHP